jgi:hypothetical protein
MNISFIRGYVAQLPKQQPICLTAWRRGDQEKGLVTVLEVR